MTTINDILDALKAGEEYSSSTKESYDQIASVYNERRIALLEEMSKVVKAADIYRESLDDENVVQSTAWANYTQADLFDGCVSNAISDLAYELGVEQNGSNFWEPSTC